MLPGRDGTSEAVDVEGQDDVAHVDAEERHEEADRVDDGPANQAARTTRESRQFCIASNF